MSKKHDSTRKEHTVSVTAASYAKLYEASRRLGVPIGEIIARMIDRAEQTEMVDP